MLVCLKVTLKLGPNVHTLAVLFKRVFGFIETSALEFFTVVKLTNIRQCRKLLIASYRGAFTSVRFCTFLNKHILNLNSSLLVMPGAVKFCKTFEKHKPGENGETRRSECKWVQFIQFQSAGCPTYSRRMKRATNCNSNHIDFDDSVRVSSASISCSGYSSSPHAPW